MSGRPPFLIFVFLIALCSLSFVAHMQTPETARGVIRLKVKYKTGETTRELPRKRFFLIHGSRDENKVLIEQIKQAAVTSRECYYRSQGASDAFINWLKENDCESVYCRDIEEKYLAGNGTVPEFRTAYEQALTELKTVGLARRWLPNYLPAQLRDGYYNSKQQSINKLIKEAENRSGKPIMSIMTDRKGTAYLTDIEPGTYMISNLAGAETEKSSILWICEREVKATDLAIAMRRPFTLSNETDPRVKCEVIERPLPA